MNSIINLEYRINELKEKDKDSYKLFKSIFQVSSATGKMEIPYTFKDKVRSYFGNKNEDGNITETADEIIKRIETQKVVKTYNKLTGRGSLFNSLRASRPGMRPDELHNEKKKVNEYIEKSKEECDFCEPEKYLTAYAAHLTRKFRASTVKINLASIKTFYKSFKIDRPEIDLNLKDDDKLVTWKY